MDFDSVLKEVGDFGRFQKRRLALLGFPVLIGTLHLFLQVFAAGKSDHCCQSWQNEECGAINLTQVQCENFKREISIPVTVSEDNKTFEQCEKFNVTGVDFETAIGIVGENVSQKTIPCDEGWVHDQSIFPSTIIIDFELVCSKSYLPNIAQSIYFAGKMIGTFVFGIAADIFGRRKTQLFSYVCGSLLAFASTVSLNFWMYVVLRFLTSVFLSGIGLNCFVLANELVGPSRRVLASNMIWLYFSVGYGVLSGLAKLIPNWRILQLVVTLPYIPLLTLTYFFIPESPRWLVNQERSDDAEKVMRKIAKENEMTLREDFDMKNCTKDEIHNSSTLKQDFLEVIRSRVILLMMINMTFNWVVQAIVYYGLSLSTSSLGIDPYISFVISGAIEIPAYSSCIFVAEWFGRKRTTFFTLILAGIACCCTSLVPYGIPRAVVAILGKFFVTMSFSVVITWALELLPTSLRTSGLSILSMTSRIGPILAPVILILEDTWSSLPVLLFGSLSIIAGFLCLFFPETKGKFLPSTVREAEGLHRNVAFDAGPEELQIDDGDCSKESSQVPECPKQL